MYDLSIVIPTCQSAGFIYRSLSEMHAVLSPEIDGLQYVVINNGGGADVGREILRFREKHRDVVLVNCAVNYGQQAAVQKGLQLAGGQFIMTTDDDLQYAPSDMLRLYRQMKEAPDVDVYCGFSKSKHKSDRYNFYARLVTFVLSYIYFPGFRKANYFTALKIFRRSALFKEGEWLGVNVYFFWELDPKKIRSLAVEQRQRVAGSSNYKLSSYLLFFRHIIVKMAEITLLFVLILTGALGWFIFPVSSWLAIIAVELILLFVIRTLLIHFRKYKFQVSSIIE